MPSARWAVLLVCGVLGATPLSLAAQHDRPVTPGTRVRVHHADACCVSPLVGTLVSLHGDSLLVRTAGAPVATVLSRAAVHGLEAARVRQPHVGTGAVLGLAAGAVVGGAVGVASAGCGPADDVCVSAFRGVITGVLGALGGALLGAALGAQIRDEEWRVVPLPTHVGAKGSRTPAAGVQVVLRF